MHPNQVQQYPQSTGLANFLKNNSWGIVTSLFLIAMSLGVWTSRIEQIEFQLKQHDESIRALQSVATLSVEVSTLIESQKEIKMQMQKYESDLQRFYREDWLKVERLVLQLEAKNR